MTSLFSYCIPIDDGAAPNPFWGVCTLVICKPRIRSSARVGDWVVGTGAKFAQLGDGGTRDLRGRVVYAMKVTKKLTLQEYDDYSRRELPQKVPDWTNSDPSRRVGDAIYDYSSGQPVQRRGVHRPYNMETDLSGTFALLSTHFYYFGDLAVPLPDHLGPIAQNQQGHRRQRNDPYLQQFVEWIEGRRHPPASVLGKPLCDLFSNASTCGWCSTQRAEEDERDDELGNTHPER